MKTKTKIMRKKAFSECLTKKGISPLIATVLLIGFAIALAAIVFKWGGGFTKDLSKQTSYELASGIQCTKTVNLMIEQSCILGNKIRIKATNKADGSLAGAIIRIINTQNQIKQTDLNIIVNPFQTVNFDGYYDGIPKNILKSRITIIPKISVNDKIEICPAKDFEFDGSNCQNLLKYGSFEGVNVFLNHVPPDPIDPPDIWYPSSLGIADTLDNTELFGDKTLQITSLGYVYQSTSIESGRSYTITGWIKPAIGGSGRITLSPSGCSGISTDTVSTNEWVFVNQSMPATDSCTSSADLKLENLGVTVGVTVEFDNIQLFES